MSIDIKLGTQVTFEGDDCKIYQGTYLGIAQPFEWRQHVIHVQGRRDANWIRVGSDRELSIKPVTSSEREALDQIAEAYNSSSTTLQDIVNAVDKALREAGYELKF